MPENLGLHFILLQVGTNVGNLLESVLFIFRSILGRATFAQERVFVDELVRFPSKAHNIMYVIPLVYQILSTTKYLSTARLHRALHAVVRKHGILRTALYLDTNHTIVQECVDINATITDHDPYGFSLIHLDNGNDIQEAIKKIINRSDLFDLAKGRVVYCHIVRHHRSGHLLAPHGDTLAANDLVLFTIHHSIFDGGSVPIFLDDLSWAYANDCSFPIDNNIMQCIDSAVYERLMDMAQSHEYWQSEFATYSFERPLALPVDRHCLSTDYRSGLKFTAQIYLDDNITKEFLDYAAAHNTSPFQLALATFYAFLFKLTRGQNDLCISCLHANRYRAELQNIIGMFVATLPVRVQLDSRWAFAELVRSVQEKCLSNFAHSHYPLQQILADHRLNYSNAPFLSVLFELNTVSSDVHQLKLDGATLEQVYVEELHEATLFDLNVIFVYNPKVETKKLLFHVYGSRDVFEQSTVSKIAQRLQGIFSQLFETKSKFTKMDQLIPIGELSVTLPEEADEMQGAIFRRSSNFINEGMLVVLKTCTWL